MSYKNNIPEYYVSEFNKSFKDVIETNFNYISVRGEISEIKPASRGQIYLVLKENDSVLSGVIWENKKKYLKFNPEIGTEVIATGKITTWSKYKTTYQIDIDQLEVAGEGALLKLIEDRKERLRKKGYFDSINKKTIPFLPSKIGIITSASGSVIHDIINRLKARFPIPVELWPVAVQGNESLPSIIKAIRGFNEFSDNEKPDVIIIARGGGSTEDLMAFNEEQLAIEVFNSKIPIISAIGHETDVTIIDFVSDIRASTPTAAAEIVVPERIELKNKIFQLNDKLDYLLNNIILSNKDFLINLKKLLKSPNQIYNSHKEKLQNFINNLDKLVNNNQINKKNIFNNISKFLKFPENKIHSKKNDYIKLFKILDHNINNKISFKKRVILDLNRLLNSNSVNENLKKGFVIISKSNKILKKSNLVKEEDKLSIKFFDKSIGVKINKIS